MAVCRNADRIGLHGGGPTDRHGSTNQDNHAALPDAFCHAALGAAMMLVANPTLPKMASKAWQIRISAVRRHEGGQKKIDEFAEAERLLGGPAANRNACGWVGAS